MKCHNYVQIRLFFKKTKFTLSKFIFFHFKTLFAFTFIVVLWCNGYPYCITSFDKLGTQLCAYSNPCCGVVEICNGENPRQLLRLGIRPNVFRLPIIPQNSYHHHHHHHHHHRILGFCHGDFISFNS